jgi:predicted cupin superfamily sugar epimerase
MDPEAAQLVARLGLEPLPVEGGWFRQTWRSATVDAAGRPAGTAIIALYTTDDEGFSALHRLATPEVWHFYGGDPFGLLLLHPDGSSEDVLLGTETVQAIVPAGTWMGGRVADGGRFSLTGATMAPGFTAAEFEAGDREALVAAYPSRAFEIARLTRPGGARVMPPERSDPA